MRAVPPPGTGDRHLTRMHSKSSLVAVLAAAVALSLAGTGCKREQSTPIPPRVGAPGSPAQPVSPPAVNPVPGIPVPGAPTGADVLGWELPQGWSEARTGGMRFATLKAPVPGKLDISVVMLPGAAGGELANVNRWRGQIKLPPVDEAARAKLRQQVDAQVGPVSVYDFATEGADAQRMMAGLILVGDRSWFVKMVGDASAVEAARPGFLALLKSLRLGGA